MSARHYTDEEVTALRDRARDLMRDLAEVFDAIAGKVEALKGDLVDEPDTGALEAPRRDDDRGAGG